MVCRTGLIPSWTIRAGVASTPRTPASTRTRPRSAPRFTTAITCTPQASGYRGRRRGNRFAARRRRSVRPGPDQTHRPPRPRRQTQTRTRRQKRQVHTLTRRGTDVRKPQSLPPPRRPLAHRLRTRTLGLPPRPPRRPSRRTRLRRPSLRHTRRRTPQLVPPTARRTRSEHLETA